MPLYDQPPPHLLTLYRTGTTQGTGGGQQLTEELVQADIPVSINRGKSVNRSMFDQTQDVINCQVGVLSAYLTTTPQRSWVGRTVHTETGAEETLKFTGGVSVGEEYNGIPSLTYFSVELWL